MDPRAAYERQIIWPRCCDKLVSRAEIWLSKGLQEKWLRIPVEIHMANYSIPAQSSSKVQQLKNLKFASKVIMIVAA